MDVGLRSKRGRLAGGARRASRAAGLPIILLTGWHEQPPEEAGEGPLVDRVLTKPIRLADLLEVVAALTPPTPV